MPSYSKQLFDLIKNDEYTFYKLIIDDVCHFDEFAQEIEQMPRELSKLKSVYAIMERFSSHVMLPKTKFRQIKGITRKDVFEFKKDMVRVYVILHKPDVYVVTGSVKNDQDKTIQRFDKKIKDFEP